jgi:hypothetical protein
LLVAGCLVLAGLAHYLPAGPTYDPWAWISWGREITEWNLDTRTGPSWKPLPVLFTTPFALAGDKAAPELWLVVAQAGGLLAIAFTYRLAARLAGWPAGLIAAAGLVLADEFIRNFARGNSEGLLVALVLWAIERHLDGRRRDAFLLGFAAGLLRPELWPFLLAYGLWLMWTEPRTRVLVVGCGVLTVVAWIVPEYLGSGDFMRAASRAREPNPDSAAFADFPFAETFARAAGVLMAPLLLGAVIALVRAWAVRDRVRLTLGAVAGALLVAVAAMTQAGFAGNLRYVALPAALVCVLAGAGWVWLIKVANRRLGTVAACALALLIAGLSAGPARDDVGELDMAWQRIVAEADLYGTVPDAIEAGGGEAALKSCGSVYTGAFQTQAVAWYMHLHEMQTEIFAFPPGTTIAPTFSSLSRDPRFPTIAKTRKWVIGSSCAR